MTESFLTRLYETLHQDRLGKKVLLCDSYAQGHQWVESMSRTLGPIMNTEVTTLQAVVLEKAKPLLLSQGIVYLDSQKLFWVVYNILHELVKEKNSYIRPEMLTPGLVHAFTRSVRELRQANIQAEQLSDGDFEQKEKGQFVKMLLNRYEQKLLSDGLADFPRLVALLQDRPTEDAKGPLYVIHEHRFPTLAERDALQLVSAGHMGRVSAEIPFTQAGSYFPHATTEWFHGSGALAEVREVFRRMADRSLPSDQVEFILSDYPNQIGCVQSVANQLKIPCTYAEGLSVRYSRIGQAAMSYLDWLESNYHIDHIITAFRSGLFRLPNEEEGSIPTSGLIRLLEKSGIGWGRERYSLLESLVVNTEEEARTKAALIAFFKAGLLHQETDAASPSHILAHIVNVVNYYTSSSSAEEQQVFNHIKDLQNSTQGITASVPLPMAIAFVREILDSIAFMPTSMPQPGHLFVSSLASAGQSGRCHSFIIGMDERTCSITPKQDPVLLDEERVRISPHLLSSVVRAEQRQKERSSRLGMIRGNCTLSYSAFDVGERREQYPAYDMLQLFRLQQDQPDVNMESMVHSFGEIIGYSRSVNSITLDQVDGWMKQLLSKYGTIVDGHSQVTALYGNLQQGEAAAAARNDLDISVYEGMVDSSRFPLEFSNDSLRSVSASKLELYARCPMQFFYQEVLGIRVKEKAEFDRSLWLDAMQRGSLLHLIYQRYYSSLQPGNEHDEQLLSKITEEALLEYEQLVPAPSPHIKSKEANSIRRDTAVFFRNEQQRLSAPIHLELQLHSEEAPFQVEIGDELTLPMKGFVDRIDRLAPHQYKIYDYKTGSPSKYKANEYFSKGTQLQHALYAAAVEQWMHREGIDPGAEVVESAYYFPTERGMGEEVVRPQNRREDFVQIISHMTNAIRNGLFPPTYEPSRCTYCDYQAVCAGHAGKMKKKIEDETVQKRLHALTEVHRFA
jgi:ATP-dependent helicase/nuclease subunit B